MLDTTAYRIRAAEEVGLPVKYADRLRGNSYGEFLEDARMMMHDYHHTPEPGEGPQHEKGWCPPLGNPDPRPSEREPKPEDRYIRQLEKALERAESDRSIWKVLDFRD